MKKSSLLALTVLAFFSSCGSGSEPASPPNDAPQHAHDTEAAPTLSLDNGAKWKVNEPTQQCMGNMQKLLTDFDGSASKDYAALGAALQTEAHTIIQKCTMTGPAHDQLHVVINPLFEVIQSLKSGDGGKDECEALRKHLKDYHSHFEH